MVRLLCSQTGSEVQAHACHSSAGGWVLMAQVALMQLHLTSLKQSVVCLSGKFNSSLSSVFSVPTCCI
jgi:hypothetical protein